MKPLVEINIPTYGGDVLRYGLAIDDHCVVVLQWHEREQVCSGGTGEEAIEGFIEAGWRSVRNGYIPSRVAAHMSALALQDLANDAAGWAAMDAEHRILNPGAPVMQADAQATDPNRIN